MFKRKEKALPLKKAVSLCTGADFWTTKRFDKYGVPALRMADGPHGLRVQDHGGGFGMLGVAPSRPATCFPTAVTLAASWDAELLEAVGRAIGEEALGYGVGLVLGPGANIKRSPLCGRNFEYYSEDPYLSGKLAAAFIRGVQGTGVGACLKHFAANSQERDRLISDSVLDERTLREIYLTAFETAVREGRPASVMCAYNKLNGVYCSDNRRLLTEILRDEWGFDGMVVTDWGAMHDRVKAFEAGCDLDMPGGHSYGERETRRAVKTGVLAREYVDKSAARVKRLAEGAKKALSGMHIYDLTAHHELAMKAACEGAVLLKNEGGLLPLKPGTRMALIGDMARRMRYQGSGSSHINPANLSEPVDNLPFTLYARGCDADGNTDGELLSGAAAAARDAEVAVVVAGLPDSYESEGFDRADMRLPKGVDRLIETVAAANEDTCVVLLCGSPVECPWEDKVRAVLYMGLPGEAGGETVRELLYGYAEPGGRLAESWPVSYSDSPASDIYAAGRDALYEEGVYVGYRYYETAGVSVRWPFGHGLSLTGFEYKDLRVSSDSAAVTVKNTGGRPGSEVVQLYIRPPRSQIHRPALELKGFKKVRLAPGESCDVSFALDRRSFALWQDGWRVPGGEYTVCVGASSEDIRLTATLDIAGDEGLAAPAYQRGSWYESLSGKPDRASWEAMLGRRYVPYVPEKGSYSMNNTPWEMRGRSALMRLVCFGISFALGFGYGRDRDRNPAYRMMLSSSAMAPMRTLQINGRVPGWLLRTALTVANGFKRPAAL